MQRKNAKVQTFSYKISEFWGFNVQHSDYG